MEDRELRSDAGQGPVNRVEAARPAAEALRRGMPISGIDLVVAATARHHRQILVARDSGFSQVAGLAIEAH